jgi:hypothetical protein
MSKFSTFLASIEESLVSLRAKDMEAYEQTQKSGVKTNSNEVSAYVKRFLVMKAFHNTSNCCLPAVTYVSVKSMAIIANALSYYRQYDLISSCQITVDKGGVFKIDYQLNEDNISNGYRKYLNDSFGLTIPEITRDDKLKEVDNNLLDAINSFDEIDLRKAGVY